MTRIPAQFLPHDSMNYEVFLFVGKLQKIKEGRRTFYRHRYVDYNVSSNTQSGTGRGPIPRGATKVPEPTISWGLLGLAASALTFRKRL